MKRWIGSLALACVAGAAFAQAPFTIVRPADESRVREKVRILIPKGSIPSGGYVGFFLDGSLLEATVPPLQGRYYVYTLDTKGRGLSDGKHKLEAVLYVDYKEQPRIVDRSSVDINIANVSSIRVPNSGLTLKYRFVPGTQWIYTLQQRTTMYTITEQQQRAGGRAAELPVEFEKFRMLYAVDNVFAGGDGLVRMQALPLKGKNFVELTPTGQTTPQRYEENQLAPIYMRLRPNGTQVYGSIPPYVPVEGTGGGGDRTDLYAAFPLPSLPNKAVRPGDSWAARFQNGRIDMEKLNEVTSVVRTFPARGEFVGVEWESGHPCAKIRNTISVGAKSLEGAKLQGDETADDKVSLNETVWFAMDTRQVLKIVRDLTLEVKEQQGGFGGGFGGGPRGPGGPMGGPSGGPMSGGGRMGPGAMGPGGRMGGGAVGDRQMPPGMGGGRPGQGGYPGGYPGMGGGQGFPGMGGGQGFPGMGGPRGGAGGGTQTTFTKLRIQYIFTLDR